MDFYDRVKELAKERHLSLLPLLQSVGINYETYKSAKRFGNLPRANEAVAIAKVLHTTAEYLVTGEENDIARKELEELKKTLLKLAQ